MGVQEISGIVVRGRPVATGMVVNAFDRIEITARGVVNFGGLFGSFLSTAVLPADGDNHRTPPDYPAPQFRKNSLIVEVRSQTVDGYQRWSRFYQGGTNRVIVPSDGGTVFLFANDATPDDNSDGWTVNLRRIFPDLGRSVLAVEKIELVQAIQRLDNSVPLVTGKPTVARVFPTSGSFNRIERVTGRCRVRFANGITETAPMIRSGGSREFITARPRGGLLRDIPTSSLNFLIRNAPAGQMLVTADIWADGQTGQPDRSATGVVAATIQNARPISIQPFLVALPAHGLAAPTLDRAMQVLRASLDRFPFGSTTRILPARSWAFLDPIQAWGWERLAGQMGGLLNAPWDAIRLGFCMQPPNTNYSGYALRFPLSPFPGAVTAIRGDDYDISSCTHELGHTLGLNHVEGCGAGALFDMDLPRETEEPSWRFDGRPDQTTVVPAGLPETMSYCLDNRFPNDRFPSVVGYKFMHFGHHT